MDQSYLLQPILRFKKRYKVQKPVLVIHEQMYLKEHSEQRIAQPIVTVLKSI